MKKFLTRKGKYGGSAEKTGYRVANLQGIGTRQRQEDSFAFVNAMDAAAIRNKGMMFVVADGMGGMKDGKLASETAVSASKHLFQEMDREGDLAQQLRDGMFWAGDQVFQALGGDGGSTIVACILFRERLYFASVGDSFLYLQRDGELIRLNQEHNVQNERYLEQIRSDRLDPVFLNNAPDTGALTQFLGMDGMDRIDCLRRPLCMQDGDILLACSDGVGGVLSQQTIRSCMECGDPGDICNALETEIIAQRRNSQDNYTALVVQCTY